MTLGAGSAGAQTGWSATLFIDPYPSPYLSDWEINPNISTLTVINGTGSPQTATAVYRVTNAAGRILASGRSDPQTIPPDDPRVYTSFVDIAGTSSHDAATEDGMVRTGRLPEGTYRACVAIAHGNGFVVAEACADFTILYPDPPLLLAPGNGEIVGTTSPFLQWTPMQVPAEFQIRYILQMAVVLPHQTPDEALNGPVPHYVNPDAGATNFQYPLDAPPLEEGRVYAWRVIALDHNGYAAAANGGASETYVFRYDPGNLPSPGQSVITLSMHNAFDEEPDDGTFGTRNGGTATQRGLEELCANWSDPAAEFVLTTDSPLGFRRFAGNAATLFQDDATKHWWIRTTSPNGNRDVLIGGGCNRWNDATIVHWIASKNDAARQWISEKLSSPLLQAMPGPNIDNVNYSMVVLSKGSHTVSVPDEFDDGVTFLGGRELEVATGLNLYSEIDFQEMALWPFFEWMGFTEKRVTLYGFLGWDASWSFGGTVGSDGGQIDASTEHKFMVLRATLPQRTPNKLLAGWIESTGLELEIALGDSTGRAWKKGGGGLKPEVNASVELIPRLIHRVVLNDNLTLEGSIGLDFAREMKDAGVMMEAASRTWSYLRGRESALPDPEYNTSILISYGLVTQSGLPLGPRGNVHLDGLSVVVKVPRADPKSQQEIMIAGNFGVRGQSEIGNLGLALKRTDLAALHKKLADLRKALYEAGTKVSASETGECTAGETRSAQKEKWCTIDAAIKGLEKALAEHEAGLEGKNAKAASDWEWRLRASVGHMSLGQVLALIKEGGS
jgi:hypothetical protein